MTQAGFSTRAGSRRTIAVYTTMYPGVEIYLADWYRSLRRQTDQGFQLWIGLDELTSESVQNNLGSDLKSNWVTVFSGATPAQVRQEALAQIVETCSGVVLVDSDDLLHASRVAAAREALQDSDLAGCALCLMDETGQNLGLTFDLPPRLTPEDVFPRNNIFGFSNSAYRTDLLRRCLPIPSDAVLVDWFLSTRAWLLGARLVFDHVPRMDYRQYPANTARVRFPFSPEQVVSDTALVRRHFELVLAEHRRDYVADRYAAVEKVARDIENFYQRIILHPANLDGYVKALNAVHPTPLWWSCVANPTLGHMWC